MKHGAARKGSWTPEYVAWRSMKTRCHCPGSSGYSKYGARGIAVSPEWREDYAAFLAHVGPRPSAEYSLERIDNSRGYEPGNVRWATSKEQARNRRSSRFVEHAGETLTLAGWAERAGLTLATVRNRIRAGWPMEKVLSAPVCPGWPKGKTKS